MTALSSVFYVSLFVLLSTPAIYGKTASTENRSGSVAQTPSQPDPNLEKGLEGHGLGKLVLQVHNGANVRTGDPLANTPQVDLRDADTQPPLSTNRTVGPGRRKSNE